MSKQTNSKTIKTSIGGQAVIEGVMMRGPKLTALSVRMPDQSISTETWDTPNSNKWYKRHHLSEVYSICRIADRWLQKSDEGCRKSRTGRRRGRAVQI